MSDTKQQLITALLKIGNVRLGELWDVDAVEAGRRINEQRSIPLAHFADALDAMGVKLVNTKHHVVIDKDEVASLNLLAGRYLDMRREQDK